MRLSLPTPETHVFKTPFELLEHLDNQAAEPLFDLVVLRPTASGISTMQAARDARKAHFSGEIVLSEESESYAFEAHRLHIAGYLVEPIEPSALEQTLEAPLARLSRLDAESTTMRMRGGVKRVPFTQFVYAQTVNHDQVLFMRDGTTMQLRCSSQDLFDRLAHDARFLKMGSSYIVNLDLVRSLSASGDTISFIEGSKATVPVRFRKTVQDALFARAEWRKHA